MNLEISNSDFFEIVREISGNDEKSAEIKRKLIENWVSQVFSNFNDDDKFKLFKKLLISLGRGRGIVNVTWSDDMVCHMKEFVSSMSQERSLEIVKLMTSEKSYFADTGLAQIMVECGLIKNSEISFSDFMSRQNNVTGLEKGYLYDLFEFNKKCEFKSIGSISALSEQGNHYYVVKFLDDFLGDFSVKDSDGKIVGEVIRKGFSFNKDIKKKIDDDLKSVADEVDFDWLDFNENINVFSKNQHSVCTSSKKNAYKLVEIFFELINKKGIDCLSEKIESKNEPVIFWLAKEQPLAFRRLFERLESNDEFIEVLKNTRNEKGHTILLKLFQSATSPTVTEKLMRTIGKLVKNQPIYGVDGFIGCLSLNDFHLSEIKWHEANKILSSTGELERKVEDDVIEKLKLLHFKLIVKGRAEKYEYGYKFNCEDFFGYNFDPASEKFYLEDENVKILESGKFFDFISNQSPNNDEALKVLEGIEKKVCKSEAKDLSDVDAKEYFRVRDLFMKVLQEKKYDLSFTSSLDEVGVARVDMPKNGRF